MSTIEILFAQSLDNVSPDDFVVGGVSMGPDMEDVRRHAKAKFAQVTRVGTAAEIGEGVRIIWGAEHYVVAVAPPERDVAGRVAPMIAYGTWEAEAGEAFGRDVGEQLARFADSIGRTVSQRQIAAIATAFESKKKRRQRGRVIVLVALAVFGLACVALGCWLTN